MVEVGISILAGERNADGVTNIGEIPATNG